MNNNRLSSKFPDPLGTNLISSPALVGTIATLQKSADCELRTVEINTEKNLNYNLLLEKIKDLLSRPSNFEVYPDGKIFIKSEQKF
jgi:hypothetical protein